MKKLILCGILSLMYTFVYAEEEKLYKPVVAIYGQYSVKQFEVNPVTLGFEGKEYFTAEECKKMIKISTDMEAERIKGIYEQWNKGNRFTDNAIYSDNLMIGFCIPKDETTIKFYPKQEDINIINFKDYPAFTDEAVKKHESIKYKEDMYKFVSIPWVNYMPVEYGYHDVAQIGLVEKSYYTRKECSKVISAYIKFQKYAEDDLKDKVSFEKYSDTVYKIAGHMYSVHCYPLDESKLTYDPVKEIPLDERGRIVDYPVFLDEPRPIYKTSFACNPKRWTVTERLICTNEVLADLDIELSEVYKKALKEAASAEEKENIRTAQREWVEEQSSMINSIELKKMYVNRIEELSDE